MRMQKLREEAAEKVRDKHFSTILSVILMKQEWRVKEKTDIPTPTASDDNMDLMDVDESPLIKDGSPQPTSMDITMMFTLLTEFKGAEEEVS
jgi:hypothetical protein